MGKQDLINEWIESKLITDEDLLEAFRKVKREKFVLEDYIDYAYTDIPLSIMRGQTISQPTTVMIMTQALNVKKGNKILEIGAGSGYQAAILSELVGKKGKIYTIEYIPEVAEFASRNLNSYKNVKVICADGSKGYGKEAPYDRIIITAAAPELPKNLLKQLKTNGIMVVPVGKYEQQMYKIIKKKNVIEKEYLGDFRFVELKGKYGFY